MKLLIISLKFLTLAMELSFGQVLEVPTRRINNGRQVEIEEFPYQVSLQSSGVPICGGVLISESFVLTAAHCFIENITHARAGSSRNDEGELFEINEIFIHPLFGAESVFDYDFAILKLKKSTKIPKAFDFAKLPEDFEEPLVGQMGVVSGWGLTEDLILSKHLRAVEIPVVSQPLCREFYDAASITDRMFCAGYRFGGRDSCRGDSGGPLMSKFDNILIGIVSWGEASCSETSGPGVYAKVSSVRSWIRNITNI